MKTTDQFTLKDITAPMTKFRSKGILTDACQHQWFKLVDVSKYASTPNMRVDRGDMASSNIVGVKVVCANCETQKTLWEKEE